jgi:hypothetical protein
MPRFSAVALLALLLLGGPAFAKDVCVVLNTGVRIVFKKVKSLKKPGAAITLNGFYVAAGGAAPLSGTAISTVAFGFFVHAMAPIFATNAEFVLMGSEDFTASGQVDGTGDMIGDAATSMTPIDCDTVDIP